MKFTGGKWRQGPAIAEHVARLRGDRKLHVEPFCGALWSAAAIARAVSDPDLVFELSDVNPWLVQMWESLLTGWEPPAYVTLDDFQLYKATKPLEDPLTAYLGFGSSFRGMFYASAVQDKRNPRMATPISGTPKRGAQSPVLIDSRRTTLRKVESLVGREVVLGCRDYHEALPTNASVYLDPPYFGRARQMEAQGEFDQEAFYAYMEELVCPARRNVVVTTAFGEYPGCRVLHDWGDTVAVPNRVEANRISEVLMLVPTGWKRPR